MTKHHDVMISLMKLSEMDRSRISCVKQSPNIVMTECFGQNNVDTDQTAPT